MAKFLLKLVASVVLVSAAPLAQAYTFVPTDPEWATWPTYCQQRYAQTRQGRDTGFSRFLNPAQARGLEAQIGHLTWLHLHHYCAGYAYLNRAQLESEPNRRKFLFERAESEANYTFSKIPPSAPLAPTIAGTLAKAMNALGDTAEAARVLQSIVAAQPDVASPYAQLALFYRDQGNRNKAIDVLEQGSATIGHPSAEISYFLGLLYLDAGRLDDAQKQASEAYRLGYPLAGLKNRLAAIDKWPPR